VKVELVSVIEAARPEEMGGAIHLGVELAPRPPRAAARVVLEDQEEPLGKAARFVLERAPQGAGARDQHAGQSFLRLATKSAMRARASLSRRREAA